MMPADFNYDLPRDLIARRPLPDRAASRLLRVEPAGFQDLRFAALPGVLRPGDLLVLNDTRVVPARLFGRKSSGGRIEMLLERVVEPCVALAQIRSSHAPKAGSLLEFESGITARVLGRQEEFFLLRFPLPVLPLLEQRGHVPLPPYLEREDEPDDRERYQTVYARERGSVAAPTAGLHFDAALLAALPAQGVQVASLTLHVGAGTFAPLRPHQLESGRLHAERLEVASGLCSAVSACRARGGRVVAVGTTTVRGLEAAAAGGALKPCSGETELFIRPGFPFRVVDALITNFHLPRSSLLMLVCAFGGTDRVLAAYRHAVAHRYRFYSYGDAMFIENVQPPNRARVP